MRAIFNNVIGEEVISKNPYFELEGDKKLIDVKVLNSSNPEVKEGDIVVVASKACQEEEGKLIFNSKEIIIIR